MLFHLHFDSLSDMTTSILPLFIQRSEFVVPFVSILLRIMCLFLVNFH